MKRSAIFGAAAVLLFLFTAATVRNYLKSIHASEPLRAAAPATQVVVAADDIPVGTTLAAEHLRTVAWPADAVPAGAPTRPDAVIGWVARASLVRNEPLIPEKLADPNARGVLPLVIPPGMRAASVRVNEVTGISGFVTPGSKVDIIAVVEAKGEAGGREAFTLLEDVEVLAIAQTMDHKDTKPTLVNTVTLLVSSAQAERLTLAAAEGTLQLALRNFQDRSPGRAPGITVADLVGAPAPPTAVPSVAAQVELLRGPERVVQRF
jgi:pilus assembly protein CpaB